MLQRKSISTMATPPGWPPPAAANSRRNCAVGGGPGWVAGRREERNARRVQRRPLAGAGQPRRRPPAHTRHQSGRPSRRCEHRQPAPTCSLKGSLLYTANPLSRPAAKQPKSWLKEKPSRAGCCSCAGADIAALTPAAVWRAPPPLTAAAGSCRLSLPGLARYQRAFKATLLRAVASRALSGQLGNKRKTDGSASTRALVMQLPDLGETSDSCWITWPSTRAACSFATARTASRPPGVGPGSVWDGAGGVPVARLDPGGVLKAGAAVAAATSAPAGDRGALPKPSLPPSSGLPFMLTVRVQAKAAASPAGQLQSPLRRPCSSGR